jgi:hypothetical protein
MRTALALDNNIEQCQVPRDRISHPCPVRLPRRGAAFDVGEQEGDGAAW